MKDHEIAAFVNRLVRVVTDNGITHQLREAIRAEVLDTLRPPAPLVTYHSGDGPPTPADAYRLIPGFVTERSSDFNAAFLADTTLQ
jgi:hypothetical protein